MSKRQLVVAWIMAIGISFIIFATPKYVEIKRVKFPLKFRANIIGITNWDKILSLSIVVLIFGGLLIYTLRTRRK